MSKKFAGIILFTLVMVLMSLVSEGFASRASDRRALMKQTLKIKKQQTTGIKEEESEQTKESQDKTKSESYHSIKPTSKEVEKPTEYKYETPKPTEKTQSTSVPTRTYKRTEVQTKPKETVQIPVRTKIDVPEIIPAKGDDELLRLIPEDALFCLRINNIDESLMSLDEYLLGVAPVQINVLAKMQIGSMLGDPMLNDVNTEGNLAIFGVKSWIKTDEGAPEAPVIGMILPIKSEEFKIKYHNSDIGSNNYGLVLISGDEIEHAAGTLKDKILKSSVMSRLDAKEYQRATTSPIWAFGNVKQIAKDFRSEINDSLTIPNPNERQLETQDKPDGPLTAQEKKELKKKRLEEKKARREQQKLQRQQDPEMAQEMPDINEQNMKMAQAYFDFIKTLIKGADFTSITVEASSERLDIKQRFAAESNTKLAKWLDTDAKTGDLKFTSMLDGTGTVNVIGKLNKESATEINLFFSDFITSTYDSKTARTYKSLMKKTMESSGEDFASSFSLTEGKPPFEFMQIMEVDDSKSYRDSAKQMALLMNEAGGPDSELPMITTYEEEISSHGGIPIDKMLLSFNFPQDTPEGQAINMMYGDGMDYRIAYTDNLDITVMGTYADEIIIDLLDNRNATEPAGDIKTVLEYLPQAQSSTFMGSFNALRLLQGVSGAVKVLPMPAPLALSVSALFDGLGQGEPKSCLGFAGNMSNGNIEVHVVLPKEHIAEIVPVIGQIQQRQMHMMQQQMQQ